MPIDFNAASTCILGMERGVVMELQSISQVSKQFNLSARTLRYYEEIGLIQAVKKDDFSYRMYDAETQLRLKQIIVLRKLRIPLKNIADILERDDVTFSIEVFQQSLNEIEDELTALSTIKSVIQSFVQQLNLPNAKLKLLDDESLLEIVDSLTISKINFKEDKTMDDLNKANERLDKLTDREVRIIFIPPATVAAAHYVGDNPEGMSGDMLHEFIHTSNLIERFPAARCYGFNHPSPGMRSDGKYGYEFQVTIPDDMDVPAPLEKKRFSGGLYAAYMIWMDEINGTGWNRLLDGWLKNHKLWNFNLSASGENMNGLLEEHLNILHWRDKDNLAQIDLLLPIKRKKE